MKKINISLVEDSEKLRRGLAALLADAPDLHCLSAYTSAEEALERLPVELPDIVLMDIRLPGMSGIECVAHLAALLPATRFLMLTAYEDSDDIFQSLAAGAHGYLLKSTAPEQLSIFFGRNHRPSVRSPRWPPASGTCSNCSPMVVLTRRSPPRCKSRSARFGPTSGGSTKSSMSTIGPMR